MTPEETGNDRPVMIFGGTRQAAAEAAKDIGLDPRKHAFPLSDAGRVLRGLGPCDVRIVAAHLADDATAYWASTEIAAHNARWFG